MIAGIIIYLIIGFIWHLVSKNRLLLSDLERGKMTSRLFHAADIFGYILMVLFWSLILLWMILKLIYLLFDRIVWVILK